MAYVRILENEEVVQNLYCWLQVSICLKAMNFFIIRLKAIPPAFIDNFFIGNIYFINS